jgi:putative protein-disulfide isomerase
MTGKIIYFGDPMCSWCYGFAPQITALIDSYSDSFDFQLVMGGLRPGGTETIGQIGDFLRHHWEDVFKRSGQPFSYEVLKKNDFIYDTEPPCRAVVTMRNWNPELEFQFYKSVQEAFYTKGVDTNDPETYESLVSDLDIDTNKFMDGFSSIEMKEKTREDFLFSQQLGVRGFPSTVLEYNEQLYLLANGYAESDYINGNIEKILKSEKLSS